MCGRFILIDVSGLGLRFRVQVTGNSPPAPRFNIAPTQTIWTITNEDGTRRAEQMRWGPDPGVGEVGQPDPQLGQRPRR